MKIIGRKYPDHPLKDATANDIDMVQSNQKG